MKILKLFSSISRLFDPVEVRRTRQIKTQWDELDDVATIIQDKKKIGKVQEIKEDKTADLLNEMNMLLERVDSDTKRIKEIINQLLSN